MCIRDSYGEETVAISEDLRVLVEDRDEERRRVQKLDVVVEQMRHELDRANRVNEQMAETFAAYKQGSESRLSTLQKERDMYMGTDTALREELEKLLKETKWLLNVGRSSIQSAPGS